MGSVLKNGTDLTKGDQQNGLGRFAIARHPIAGGRAVSGQPIPGAINMGFADGHAELLKLQDMKNVHWHKGYTRIADPWKTSP